MPRVKQQVVGLPRSRWTEEDFKSCTLPSYQRFPARRPWQGDLEGYYGDDGIMGYWIDEDDWWDQD